MTAKTHLEEAIGHLRDRIPQPPAVAIVLGSGLGDFAGQIDDPIEIPANSIPFYPTSSVQGHEGKLIFGNINGKVGHSLPLIVFKGRVHFYETGDLEPVIFPVRVARALGARILVATNASGGINPGFAEGDLMLIEDFINLTFLDPHKQIQAHGVTPFHSRKKSYLDPQLSTAILASANSLGITLQQGTYCWLKGPSYETRAEIEMLRRIGADAVGMSTVPEIAAASEMGMRCAAISLISNLAAGLTEERLTHEEVAETASRVKVTFTSLLKESILRITD